MNKDPREAVDPRWLVLAADRDSLLDHDDLLARLDAADPIRQAWSEVVEALEECEKNLRILHNANGQEEDGSRT
jgi:hypothetical protein